MDLIIGVAKNLTLQQLTPWMNSVNQSGYTGDRVLIVVGDNNIEYPQWQVITVADTHELIHEQRFRHILHYLQDKQYRYVISTDTRDVVFQRNPVEFLLLHNTYSYIASSESIALLHEQWNTQNMLNNFGEYFYNEIKHLDILNVGVLAGEYTAIKDMMKMLFLQLQRARTTKNFDLAVIDQTAYNILMRTYPYTQHTLEQRLDDAWACNLHITHHSNQWANYIKGTKPTVKNGYIVNKYNQPYYIVHQYDRDAQLLNIVLEKYK